MIEMLAVSKTIVVLAFATCSGGCTRFNPAFGDEGTRPDKSDGDADTAADDVVDDGHDDDGTTADPVPTSTDAISDASDAETSAFDDESTLTQGSTGGEGCTLTEPVPFDVSASDSLGNPIPSACGASSSWTGMATTGVSPDEILIAECGASCACKDDANTVYIAFTDLDPSPADLLAGGSMECLHVTMSRSSEVEGCTVEWMLVESMNGVDHPLFLAASSGTPDWSVAVPPATVGEAFSTCTSENCDPDAKPGEYALLLAESEPIAPGSSVSVELNPYASVPRTYDVTALFAQIDDTCAHRLGWAAIASE